MPTIPCPTCKNNVELIVHDLTSVELRCPIDGSRYYFRHNGKWESAEARRERMKDIFLCEDCGEEFHDAAKSKYTIRKKYCTTCLNKHKRENVDRYTVKAVSTGSASRRGGVMAAFRREMEKLMDEGKRE